MEPKQLAGTLAVLFATCALASAQQITFVHESSGAGSVGGVTFANSSFVITATADLANVQPFAAGWFVDHGVAEIDIAGVGVFQFVTPTRTFVNNSAQLVGFSRAGISGVDLLNGPNESTFSTWNLLTGILPSTGAGSLGQWIASDVFVDAGVLNVNSGSPSVTFRADLCNATGSAYCFGDGSGMLCPCAAFGATGEGCANSGGSGATLTGTGDACTQFDTLGFDITGVPGAKPGLLLRGNNQIASMAGDGLLCTAGGSQRSQVQVTNAGSTTFTDFAGQRFGAVSNVAAPTNFQFWYRDPANACASGGFNFSNAWTVTYWP